MMTDPTPDHSNRFAYHIGRLFHPAVICIPTLILILNDLPLKAAALWTALVAAIITMPGLLTIVVLQKQSRYIYQRQTRRPVYIIAWLSVVACLLTLLLLDGPQVLLVCIAALLVWLPLQFLINTYYTKISTHVAVAAGCATGLGMLAKLDNLPLQIVALMVVVLTIWARITTRNHTPGQVVLGLLVGVGSVLTVFPLLLN